MILAGSEDEMNNADTQQREKKEMQYKQPRGKASHSRRGRFSMLQQLVWTRPGVGGVQSHPFFVSIK